MNIQIDSTLGTVRVDVATDIDHLARYRLYLWKQVAGQWVVQPAQVDPEYADSANPADHTLKLPPAGLPNMLLQLVANVTSLVKAPGNLDMRVTVQQDPAGVGGPVMSPLTAYPVAYNKPVPFGTNIQVVASFPLTVT